MNRDNSFSVRKVPLAVVYRLFLHDLRRLGTIPRAAYLFLLSLGAGLSRVESNRSLSLTFRDVKSSVAGLDPIVWVEGSPQIQCP